MQNFKTFLQKRYGTVSRDTVREFIRDYGKLYKLTVGYNRTGHSYPNNMEFDLQTLVDNQIRDNSFCRINVTKPNGETYNGNSINFEEIEVSVRNYNRAFINHKIKSYKGDLNRIRKEYKNKEDDLNNKINSLSEEIKILDDLNVDEISEAEIRVHQTLRKLATLPDDLDKAKSICALFFSKADKESAEVSPVGEDNLEPATLGRERERRGRAIGDPRFLNVPINNIYPNQFNVEEDEEHEGDVDFDE